MQTLGTLDFKMEPLLHPLSTKKDTSSTLVSYDVNYASRALSSGKGVRWSIPIFIMNIFEYGMLDPIIQSIHLHSQTLV